MQELKDEQIEVQKSWVRKNNKEIILNKEYHANNRHNVLKVSDKEEEEEIAKNMKQKAEKRKQKIRRRRIGYMTKNMLTEINQIILQMNTEGKKRRNAKVLYPIKKLLPFLQEHAMN